MRRVLAAVLFTVVLVLPGCTVPERAEMVAFAQGWKAVGPEYKAYVEGDAKLDDAQKASRRDTIALLDKVVAGFQAGGK